MKPDAIIVPHGPGERSLVSAAILARDLRTALTVIPGRSVAEARNLGLDIAAAAGWRRIVFFDDDIIMSADQVRDACRLLDDYPIAAFTAVQFPDHSVLRHADPDPPPVQPGGGVMLVNLDWPHGRFPAIYNEDWFFMYGYAMRGGVAAAGNCIQLPYDPFVPARAAWEEPGDLIAENLFGPRLPWGEAITARQQLHEKVAATSADGRVLAALAAGRAVLDGITPLAAERLAGAVTAGIDLP